MNIVWKYAMTLAVVALASMINPGCVFACSCLPPGPPLEALANASAVFSGRVTAISTAAERGGSEPTTVTFVVAQRWKGSDQATLRIETPSSSASCGVDFTENQDYLVYASTNEGRLTASLCSRTALLAMADEDLAALGAATTPSAPTGGSTPPSTLPATGETIASTHRTVAMGGVLLIALGALMLRQRRFRTNQDV